MTSSAAVHGQRVGTTEAASRFLPPPSYEYIYFVQIAYSIMGPMVGISINLLGIGMLALLAGLSVSRMGGRVTAMLTPLLAPIGCGVVFVAVQRLVFGESLTGMTRDFVPWMISLVGVQYLALRRGFLHRFAIVIFLVGLATLPYLKSFANDESRMGLERGIGIGNPNDLGAWFGFCCVYFTILGLEIRRGWIRAGAWLLAVGCLLVVGLTVSRGPLFAIACSVVFGFRRVLKRGMIPVMTLIVLAWVAYAMGLFDRSATMYAERGLEETGRFVIWPLAFKRFLQSPLWGVGMTEVATIRPSDGVPVTPHSGFIFVALSAGIIPLVLFVMYWIRLFFDAFKSNVERHEDAPFLTALLLYTFLIVVQLNAAFMLSWAVGTCSAVTATGFLLKARQASAKNLVARTASRGRGLALVGHSRV